MTEEQAKQRCRDLRTIKTRLEELEGFHNLKGISAGHFQEYRKQVLEGEFGCYDKFSMFLLQCQTKNILGSYPTAESLHTAVAENYPSSNLEPSSNANQNEQHIEWAPIEAIDPDLQEVRSKYGSNSVLDFALTLAVPYISGCSPVPTEP